MWDTFVFENVSYMLKVKKHQSSQNEHVLNEIQIYLTDFKKIWAAKLSFEELFNTFKELNPLLDLSCHEAVEQVIALIRAGDENSCKVSTTTVSLQLSVQARISDVLIKYEVHLNPGDEEIFYNEVTVPLIKTVKYYEDQESNLFDLLKRKDKEIEEHVMQGGEISRKSLITEKLEPKEYQLNDETLVINVLRKRKRFWENFVKENGDVVSKTAEKKLELQSPQKKKIKVYSAATSTKNKGKTIIYKSDLK